MQSLSVNSDSELIALLAQDEGAAFESIYRRYSSMLLRYCYQKTGSREDSEELVQDIFESLWTRRREIQRVTALQSYLFGMAKFKVIDYIRHSTVKKKFAEHFLLFAEAYDSMNGPDIDSSEIVTMIDKSISELPVRCQTAFRMRLNDNLPYKEIARRMNISIKTVEKHISAALHHLRQDHKKPFYRPG